ncbi:YeeE/YedE family protein [bacterium]|nr:YeeE/YedE family protein [bacterium]MCI0603822.1 YeeE/YedE family protein [bacterium]
MKNIKYLLLGIGFGIALTKSEAISWFRIQEMFRFQGFQLYGIFATAIPVGMLSVWLIKQSQVKTLSGEPIAIPAKQNNHGYIIGGFLFGIGWAFTGACPGPLYAQLGSGLTVTAVTIASAILGTWVYSLLRPKLPH